MLCVAESVTSVVSGSLRAVDDIVLVVVDKNVGVLVKVVVVVDLIDPLAVSNHSRY